MAGTPVEEPDEDLRTVGQPKDGGLQPLENPEPLIIPPEQLIENYKQLIEDEAEREYLHVAELVKVRSITQILPFMSRSMDTYKRARAAPGFVAGGIRAKWWRKSFWTYLVWEGETYRKSFADNRANASITAWVKQFAGPGSCYVTWVTKGEPDWTDALTHLENPTKYYIDPWMG